MPYPSNKQLWDYLTHLVVLVIFVKEKSKKEMGCTVIRVIHLSILIV